MINGHSELQYQDNIHLLCVVQEYKTVLNILSLLTHIYNYFMNYTIKHASIFYMYIMYYMFM